MTKNHFGIRPWQLNGDQGDNVTFAASRTFKWKMSDLPKTTGRLCNYVLGLIVTLAVTVDYAPTSTQGNRAGTLTAADVARAAFQSIEVQNTLFGTPVSSNHYLGRYFSLFGFIGNGMSQACPSPIGYIDTQTAAGNGTALRFNYFIPLAALYGMKGHHSALPAFAYDNALVQLRTEAAGAVNGVTLSAGTVSVSALLLSEPEVRLGPGTNFIRYSQAAASAGQMVTIDSFGNATSLEGVEQGAGVGFLAWMGSKANSNRVRDFGGAGRPSALEYVNLPFRGLQQVRHFDPFYLSYLNACGALDTPFAGVASDADVGATPKAGPTAEKGFLYRPEDTAQNLIDAEFLPLIHPTKFAELSKIQTVQGTVSMGIKGSAGFSGEHIILAHQFHSWTPAKREDFVRKAVDSGVVSTVWGTNNVEWKTKVQGKQDLAEINLAKTRFFADTLTPKTAQANPPTQG
jgi:hypothetical protein